MAEIGTHFEGKSLTDEQRAIVDVFSGKEKEQLSYLSLTMDGNGVWNSRKAEKQRLEQGTQ